MTESKQTADKGSRKDRKSSTEKANKPLTKVKLGLPADGSQKFVTSPISAFRSWCAVCRPP